MYWQMQRLQNYSNPFVMYISSKSEASSVALEYQNVRMWEVRAGATVREPGYSEQVLLRVEVSKILITPRFVVLHHGVAHRFGCHHPDGHAGCRPEFTSFAVMRITKGK